MTAQEPYVTPRVRALATQYGVPLASVTPTGVGGRIRMADIYAAAGRSSSRSAPTPRAEAPARRTPVMVASTFSPGREVELDVFGANPLVDEARQLNMAGPGAPPTLFADGELPPFTASGVDPRELRKVPWHARHAVAAAAQPGKVLEAIERFAHSHVDFWGEYHHTGAQDYLNRVQEWIASGRAASITAVRTS